MQVAEQRAKNLLHVAVGVLGPNESKLSDSGPEDKPKRDQCGPPVRCSAWLGAAVKWLTSVPYKRVNNAS